MKTTKWFALLESLRLRHQAINIWIGAAMAFPLIPVFLGGVTLYTAWKGGQKGVRGVRSMRQAKCSVADAKRRYEAGVATVEELRSDVALTAQEYGSLLLNTLRTTIRRFVDVLDQIGQQQDASDIEALKSIGLTHVEIEAFRVRVVDANTMVAGGVGAVGAGLAAASTSTAMIGLLGTASTGTAIAGLSGAAATNATLAWLGGGSLAAGGWGMAGGAVILGGVALGPGILVAGWALDAQGEKALTRAVEKNAEVDIALGELSVVSTKLEGIVSRIYELESVVVALNEPCKLAMGVLESVVAGGFDRNRDTDLKAFQVAGIQVKSLSRALRAPVLGSDGELSDESATLVAEFEHLKMDN